MTDNQKKRYPSMAPKNWHTIRRKFRAALPREVAPSYLANLLNMGAESARANIMPTLRITGIIDQDGKPTDRAVRLRDDDQYPKVCEEIRQAVYDQELLDLAHDATADENLVRKWFANHTGFGENAARKYADFYMMLLEADPTKEADTSASTNRPQSRTSRGERPKSSAGRQGSRASDQVYSNTTAEQNTGGNSAEQTNTNSGTGSQANSTTTQRDSNAVKAQPTLHLNVQIHISPEASAEQVDQIFASMARHLKEFS